jgi:hypothetical protein
MSKALHIVSFNVPWPANYGGVIDVFYRIKALAESGVEIHLHCFTYGRDKAAELEKYCAEVRYYQRNMSFWLQFRQTPFIVESRRNAQLEKRLLEDNYPILLEGLHCCAILEDRRFAGRLIMVRAHNVESEYYSLLARSERNPIQKAYLMLEASKIKRYETILSQAQTIFAISPDDAERLRTLGCRNVVLSGAAHPYHHINIHEGMGDYALYQGNLSVPENYLAAQHLVEKIISGTGFRLVIAGANPPKSLVAKAQTAKNVTLVANPDDATMQRLVADAQVNILITNQPTGIKLKLINALYNGRHCLVNSAMVAGSQFADMCTVADSDTHLRQALTVLMQTSFPSQEVERRRHHLAKFDAAHAVTPIIEQL